jgi:hypothetical protein
MNEKFMKCCPCLNFKKDSSLVEIFEMQLRFWFMSLSVEIFVIYLISILVTELNATTDTSMQFYKCRTSQGGFKWYTLSSQVLKAQIFLLLHIFLAVLYIV